MTLSHAIRIIVGAFGRFFILRKKVSIGKTKRLVAVDIGESKEGEFYPYSVNTEGIPTFKRKKEIFKEPLHKRWVICYN